MESNSLSVRLNQYASQFEHEAQVMEREAEDHYKLALEAAEQRRRLQIETGKAKQAKEMRYKEYALHQTRTEELEEQVKLLQVKIAGERESLLRKMQEAGDYEALDNNVDYNLPALEATIIEEIAELSEDEFKKAYDNLAHDASHEQFRRLHAQLPSTLVDVKLDSWNAVYQDIVNQLAIASEKAVKEPSPF